MKGLRKYLTPFAPDQSGAVAVLYDLGGMIVICDAGGCAGNICGFDEPRWEQHSCAIFSAGLRDMDAIMGRDEALVKKIADAAARIEVRFIALIGTPVPAVIGTDYQALSRMIEKKTGLPVLSIDTNGMELYDRGEEKAYLELYRTFAAEHFPVVPGKVNVFAEALGSNGCIMPQAGGAVSSLEAVRRASEAEKNIVSSPSGIKAAQLLKERFGTPYEIAYPGAERMLVQQALLTKEGRMDDARPDGAQDAASPVCPVSVEEPGTLFAGKRVLVVHQHVLSDALRRVIAAYGAGMVTVATWFCFAQEIRRPEDISLKEEDDFTALVTEGAYDIILADSALRPLVPSFSGMWIDLPHFALSGRR